jgi:hypothetical protein
MTTQRPMVGGNPLKSTPQNIISRPAPVIVPPNLHHAYTVFRRSAYIDKTNIRSNHAGLQHRFYDRQSLPSVAPVRAIAQNGDLYSSSLDDDVEVGSNTLLLTAIKAKKRHLSTKYPDNPTPYYFLCSSCRFTANSLRARCLTQSSTP